MQKVALIVFETNAVSTQLKSAPKGNFSKNKPYVNLTFAVSAAQSTQSMKLAPCSFRRCNS